MQLKDLGGNNTTNGNMEKIRKVKNYYSNIPLLQNDI